MRKCKKNAVLLPSGEYYHKYDRIPPKYERKQNVDDDCIANEVLLRKRDWPLLLRKD